MLVCMLYFYLQQTGLVCTSACPRRAFKSLYVKTRGRRQILFYKHCFKMIIFSLVVSLLLYMKESSFKRRLVTSRLTLFVGASVRLQSIFKKF